MEQPVLKSEQPFAHCIEISGDEINFSLFSKRFSRLWKEKLLCADYLSFISLLGCHNSLK